MVFSISGGFNRLYEYTKSTPKQASKGLQSIRQADIIRSVRTKCSPIKKEPLGSKDSQARDATVKCQSLAEGTMKMITADVITTATSNQQVYPVQLSGFISEQINHCSRIYDFQKHEDFYLVFSESDDTEYEVRNLATCTCGQENCQHVAMAKMAENEMHIEIALQSLYQAHRTLAESYSEQQRAMVTLAIGQAREILSQCGVDLVQQIRYEVRAEIAAGNCEPVCDQCGEIATHFDSDAVEFRCDKVHAD